MHGAGRSGRGIALILSGWRGFYIWLGREGLVHNRQLTALAIASYIPSVSLDSPKLLFSRGLRDE